MSDIRKRTIEGLRTGDTFSVSRTFTEDDMNRFADISRDYNPVHFNDRFAGIKGCRGRICHGLLVAGLLTEIGGQIGWLAGGMDLRFKKPVYFGDTITCTLTITEIDPQGRARADCMFQNQDDETVLAATLTGIVPGAPEKAVMQAMMAEGDPTGRAG